MAVRIIVDSTCDYSPAQADEFGLLRAPLTVHWNGEEFRDGVDITPAAFFERLRNSSSLPTTSQVPAAVFGDLFRQVVDSGDEAVLFTIGSPFSGTFQSALIAQQGMQSGGEKIYLIDTGSASLGAMVLIEEGIRMRDSGAGAAQIAEMMDGAKQRLRIFACVETLKFMHKGGRLSTGAAVVGTLLSVKPVLLIKDGLISVAHKVRGNAAAYNWVAELLAQEGVDKTFPIVIGSTQCPNLLQQFTNILAEKSKLSAGRFCDIGPVIGTHVGPGTVAIACLSPKA